ncbi:hypothetical protein NP493_1848g00070 [Ridgeia piscesae]|uniref:Calcium-activated chloride channel N-terminal domain-containing protein n=1 Tax=Ridgeia piscesae TaxID=27915 RepID=A0AAD9N5R6_RIDPI|nr:hypothetical protein NP493_1848g00070 [Ridgeia piscesae]
MARLVSVLGVLALLFFVERSLGERAKITLVNNGYEGMLVAIAESVPISESDEIILRIKLFFTFASKDLFQATYHRVYFRNVTILVPKVS